MYLLTFQRVIFARSIVFIVSLNDSEDNLHDDQSGRESLIFVSDSEWHFSSQTFVCQRYNIKMLSFNLFWAFFLFFFSKYHHGLIVSHVFVVVIVLVFQCAAKFISVTEIHTYVINEKKKLFNIFVSSYVHVLISLLFCHHIPEKLNTSISDRSTWMFSLCVFNLDIV